MFSGHGTSVKEKDGDEVDGYDEAICTFSELSDDDDGRQDSAKADGKDTAIEVAKQEDDGDNNASGEADKKDDAEDSDNVDSGNNINSNNNNNNSNNDEEEKNENIILDDEIAAISPMFPENCRILGLFDC